MGKPKRPNYSQREKIRARLKAMGEPCAICGKPIDYDLDWWVDPVDGKRKRHPLSFEYDHRVPFATLSDDEYAMARSMDNAQAVHRICNQRKGKGYSRVPVSKRDDRYLANGVKAEKQIPTSRAW